MRTTSEAPVAEPHPVSRAANSAAGPNDAPVGAAQAARARGAALAIRGLAHSFGALGVIERLDLDLRAGEVLGVVGPSGCGKSTLLELVGGLRATQHGAIEVEGASSPAGRLARCAYMPQRDLLLPWLAAIDNAALAPRNRGASRAEARRLAHPLFERFGLAGFERSRPAELSGGMRQRIAFLRTLLAGKPVLLLDEPFASLDAITRAEMQEWLATALATEARTVILVTHDVEEALYLSDRVTVLSARPASRLAELSGARAPSPAAPGRRHLTRLHVRARARAGGVERGGAMRRWLPPVAIVVALLGAWELAARLEVIADALKLEPFLVPSPSEIAEALWQDRGLLAENAWVTLQEVLAGFALAVVAGAGFAVVLHLSPTLRRAFYPLLVASQTVPIVVVAPILVVWLGFGIGPKLAIVALICFFPITVNTLDGLGSVDPDLVKMMRTLDAGRWQTLRRIEAPTALPYFLSGAKIAVAVAVIGAVFGEWAGSSSGLGHLIQEASAQLQTARTFAAVVVLSAIAIALFALLAALERRIAWWGPNGAPN